MSGGTECRPPSALGGGVSVGQSMIQQKSFTSCVWQSGSSATGRDTKGGGGGICTDCAIPNSWLNLLADYINKCKANTDQLALQSQYVSDIKTSVIYQNGAPAKIVLDYVMGSPKTSTDTLDNQCKLISSDPRDK